jgi:hypothetical protein
MRCRSARRGGRRGGRRQCPDERAAAEPGDREVQQHLPQLSVERQEQGVADTHEQRRAMSTMRGLAVDVTANTTAPTMRRRGRRR